MTTTALITTTPDTALGRALDWAGLQADERKRRAAAAAASHDAESLVALTDAYLTLHGRSGARVSMHTRRVYATGVRILMAAWRQENLLHPGRDAGTAWLRTLETSGAWQKDGSVAAASPSTLRVRLAGARMLYRALRWSGATAADPFADARSSPETTAPWDKRQPYTPEQLDLLLATGSAEEQLVVLLGAHAGLRVSEICALQWTDVDSDQKTLVVRHGKGGKRRVVRMSRSLIAAFGALPRSGTMPLPLTDSALRKRMRALCAKSSVPYLGLHALRHAAGTRLVREGGSLEDAARHLGHSSIATTQVYAKWSDDQLKRQVSEW